MVDYLSGFVFLLLIGLFIRVSSNRSLSSVEANKSLAAEHFQQISAILIILNGSFELVRRDLILHVDTRLAEYEAGEVLGQFFVKALILGPIL